MAKYILDKIENIVGKVPKCWLLVFSSFPTMVSEGFFLRVGEMSFYFKLVLTLYHTIPTFNNPEKESF